MQGFSGFYPIPKPNPKERIESRTHHACLKESVFVERLWVVLCTVGLLAFRCVQNINVFAGVWVLVVKLSLCQGTSSK